MIQRIQSLLLLFAVIVNLLVLIVPSWKYVEQDGKNVEYITAMKMVQTSEAEGDVEVASTSTSFTQQPLHIGVFGSVVAASAFLFMIIFMYQNRMRQLRLTQFGIVFLMIEVVVLVLLTQGGPYMALGGAEGGNPQLGFGLPIIALLLTWWAGRRIWADEQLVRSVDRIR